MSIVTLTVLGAILPLLQAGSGGVPGQTARSAVAIDWRAADRQADTDERRLLTQAGTRAPRPSEEQLRRVEVPVLLVDPGRVRGAPGFNGQRLAYAASYDLQGATLGVFGSGTALRLGASSSLARPVRAQPIAGYFEPSENAADFSFSRFGASYTLRIECAESDDARCTNGAYLTGVARRLVVVRRSR